MGAFFLSDSQGYHVQLFLLTSQFMLIYLVAVRPFTTALLNGLEIFNELVVMGTGYCLILISDVNGSPSFRFSVGIAYISIVLTCILGNWGVLAYKIISTVVVKVKEKCKKRAKKNDYRV